MVTGYTSSSEIAALQQNIVSALLYCQLAGEVYATYRQAVSGHDDSISQAGQQYRHETKNNRKNSRSALTGQAGEAMCADFDVLAGKPYLFFMAGSASVRVSKPLASPPAPVFALPPR